MATTPIDMYRNEDWDRRENWTHDSNGEVIATGRCFEQCCDYPPIPPPTDNDTHFEAQDSYGQNADIDMTTTFHGYYQPRYDEGHAVRGHRSDDPHFETEVKTELLRYLGRDYEHRLDATTEAGSDSLQRNLNSHAAPPYLPTGVRANGPAGQKTRRRRSLQQTLEEPGVVPDEMEMQTNAAAARASESVSKSPQRHLSAAPETASPTAPLAQRKSMDDIPPPAMHEDHLQDDEGHCHASSSKETERFLCPEEGCTTVHEPFMTQGALNKHMVTHTKILKHGCDICSYRCRYPRELKRHSPTHHREGQEKPQFQCAECPRVYGRDDNLKRHIKQKHSELILPQTHSGLPSPPPTVRGERFTAR